jgi:hypothetical protein
VWVEAPPPSSGSSSATRNGFETHKRRAPVSRPCSVCSHERRHEIDQALIRRTPYRNITQRFGVSKYALSRHLKEHVPALLSKAYEAEERADADRLKGELERCFERVNLLFDACDRWLRDPDDPDRYDIGPRAEEMRVTYTDEDGGRHKATLAELLSRVSESSSGAGGLQRISVTMVETKHADPRDLVLKTAARLQDQLELLAKLLGELDERPQVNILMSPEWLEIRTAIVVALEPYEDARAAVLGALERT